MDKHVSFDENIDNASDESDEAANLIDFYGNGDNVKMITDLLGSTVLSGSDSSNGSNPFKVKSAQPFDLENFTWNSDAGRSVVNAKHANHNDDNDDVESTTVMVSTSFEANANAMMGAADEDVPQIKPNRSDLENLYFLNCRECKNAVVSNTWHAHMKRTHKRDVDPDSVPACENDDMKAVFCERCQNIMPRPALADHMKRKHRAKKMIGVIIRGGPDDDTFDKMVGDGKIYAKGGIIFCNNTGEDKE